MRYLEQSEQIVFVKWFKLQYPKYQYLIASFNNGVNCGFRIGGLLKAAGMLRGVPDLLIAVPTGSFHGLFIEMKQFKGKDAREEQLHIHEELRKVGYKVETCKGCLAAREVVLAYFSGMKCGHLSIQ